ncbi:MAG TPA: ATP-binding protein [Meiothermus sp.]|nr:ATP-binding protein [Meiothermus sp.]
MTRPTLQQLSAVPLLADLEDPELSWLIEHGEYQRFAEGETVVEQGTPADRMVILLEGALEFRFSHSADPLRIEAGNITGLLPFSRMTHFAGTAVALAPIQALFIYKSEFMPMLSAIPALAPRLVGLLTDRVRSFSQQELRREKLASLGKLAAGLAHELGNPASAAKRAAATLAESLVELETLSARLGARIGAEGMEQLLAYLGRLEPRPLSAMERADLEDELGRWLEAHNPAKAWDWAATWADAGASVEWLEGLHTLKHELAAPQALPEVLAWLEASLRVRGQVQVVQDSTERISGLVRAIKSYTYMDQTPRQEVDVREGLDNTLAIFGHRLRKGVRLERDYDPALPKISAYGSELNQLWTNLIDNALDAMGGSGTLRVRAVREGEGVLVEIRDSGPGIPPELRAKIFDPFFTTKEVGRGTGLGLETVRRIVEHHKGSIQVESQPGDTRFQVRLPSGG